METRDNWTRRRVLLSVSGASVLAGCAAEPIEEEEDSADENGEREEEDGSSEGEEDTAEPESDDDDDSPDGEDDTGEEETGDDQEEETDEAEIEDDADETEDDETDDDDSDDADDADDADESDRGEDQADDGTEADDAEEDESDNTEGQTDDAEVDDVRDDDESEEPDQSHLTLQVIGPAGEPIEGASVLGEGEPHDVDIPLEFSGETDSQGEYTDVIYENEYTIEVTHPDYESETRSHTHDGEHEVTIELASVVETSALTLTVTDSDGEPIEGASVSGEGAPHEAPIPLEFSGETDSNGEYSDVIYENEYTIEVTHPDYRDVTTEHTHDGEHELAIELELMETGDEDGDTDEEWPEIVDYELLEDDDGYVVVDGLVVNHADQEVVDASVLAWFYDADGEQLGHEDSITTHDADHTSWLSAGDEWSFEIETEIGMDEWDSYDVELRYWIGE